MMENERNRKIAQTELMNGEYNTDMRKIVVKEQKKVDKRKHLRPKVYGEGCDVCTK